MTDQQREKLLARINKATKEAAKLPREVVLRRLVDEGFVTEDGRLSARYGGRAATGR